MPVPVLIVGNGYSEGVKPWVYTEMARSLPYKAVWTGRVTDAHCKQSGAILRDGKFKFQYAVNTSSSVKCFLDASVQNFSEMDVGIQI